MKQTTQLPPEKGIPYTIHDIIMEQVRRDEARFSPVFANPLPPLEPRLPIIKHTLTSAHVFSQNIFRFSLSLLQP